ncbi:hypothetical protein L9G74_01800 [Shewanella sp. C32]|uniref:Ankyrin repeats (3 copies) n=1 Tax=Shewanella electrica TaxID=515560 RepID=A0ABT2FFU5_9GAMM|nr:hypothetical protein [Shewanella electrica]MCH1925338.1 hypothetical protein [Shewanella electrica]MCS4555163.1 hypothetical protein [Shewanella electrica]
MSLLDALKTEDYPLATELAASSSDADIRQALHDSFFMQNLHRHWCAVELLITLAQRGIVSLSLGKDQSNEHTSNKGDSNDEPSLPAELLAALELDTPAPTAPAYAIAPELLQHLFTALQRQSQQNDIEQQQQTLALLTGLLPNVTQLDSDHGELLRDAIRRQLPLTVIEQLIAAGCSPLALARDQSNYLSQIVRSVAVTDGRFAAYMAYFLAQGLNIDHADVVRDTPLSLAVKQGDCDKVALLLDLGADTYLLFRDDASLLALALAANHAEVIKLLQQHGLQFDFDSVDREQQTLLYRFLKGPGDVDLKLLALLLKDMPDLYQPNRDSYRQSPQATPMQRLLEKSPAALQLALHLLRPDLNQTDADGNSALHLAAANYVNYEQRRADDILARVKLLVSYGADATLRNHQGLTAAEVASDDDLKIEVVTWLKQQESHT